VKTRNGPLIAVVAAVAVAGVLAGGALAASRGGEPRTADGPAGPVAASTSGKTPTAGPSTTPPAKPTLAPATKVRVTLSKLATGREPQFTYLRGRQIRGGAGIPITIPGKRQISAVGRIGSNGLALVVDPSTSQQSLIEVTDVGEVIRTTPGIGTLVTSEDGTTAAYATEPASTATKRLRGGVVYFQDGASGPSKTLERPGDYEVEVLDVIGRTVYFRSSKTETGIPWQLFRWNVDGSRPVELKSAGSGTAVSADGKLVTTLSAINDTGTCSAVHELDTGKRRWRTCEYQLDGFTPDGRTVIAAPAMRDGYADLLAAALDGATGTMLREWSGISFRDTIAEDDDNLLMVADDGPETKAAIIRCNIRSGQCELATALGREPIALSS
jgi:hypothetical protein